MREWQTVNGNSGTLFFLNEWQKHTSWGKRFWGLLLSVFDTLQKQNGSRAGIWTRVASVKARYPDQAGLHGIADDVRKKVIILVTYFVKQAWTS